MSLIAFGLSLIAGWMGFSGWWAIPIGLLSFWGAKRALPYDHGRINNVGMLMYCFGAFVFMKGAGWVHAAIS